LRVDHAELGDDLLGERTLVAGLRDVLGLGRRLVLVRDAFGRAALGMRSVEAVTLADDEEAVARTQPVVLALVDEDDLVLPVELVGVDAREDLGLDILLVARGRDDLELARDRTDARAALDRVER